MTIDQIATKVNSGKTPLGGEAAYSSSGITFIRSQNVNNDRLELSDITFISPEINNSMKNSVVKANDILLNITGASLGRSCVVPSDFETGNVNQHVCIIRLKPEYNPRFIQPFLSSPKGQAIILSYQSGSGREGLNFENIKRIKVTCPKSKEQDRISELLSVLDARIQTQSKILEGLKTLINNLITAVYCNKSNGWKKQKLGELMTERTEKNTKVFPVYSVSVHKGIVNQIEHLGRSFAAKTTDHYNVVHTGDLVYTKSPTGDFPYGIVKQSFVKHNVAVSPLYGVYIPKTKAVGTLLHYYFCSPVRTSNYLHGLIQKGAKNTINITNQNFLSNEIILPTDENEINRIALTLDRIQKKIEIEGAIRERYIVQKLNLQKSLFI